MLDHSTAEPGSTTPFAAYDPESMNLRMLGNGRYRADVGRFLLVCRPVIGCGANLLGVALALLLVGSCTSESDRLSEELVPSTTGLVIDRAGAASVDLGDGDAECVARHLTDEQANDLATAVDEPGLSAGLAATVSRAVLDCVDPDQLIRSATAAFTVGVSEASVDCVAGKLNRELTEALIAANLEGVGLPAAQVELEVATALGLCLEPDELLDRG